jgi:hypothetical protein
VLALVTVVLGAGPPAVAARAQPSGDATVTWGVVPSGPDGPNGRGAFTYTLDPGGEVADVVGIVNYTHAPLSLRVYASDAARSTDGGFDLLPGSRAASDVGAWTEVRQQEVTVSPRSRVDIPFRVVVPRDATPGDHAGGIVAALRTGGDAAGGTVAVDRRVGARIHLRITGTLDPSLTVTDLRASFAGSPLGLPGQVHVSYLVRNTGNLRLVGRPTVRVSGPFGLGERRVSGAPLPELRPGDSFRVSTVVPGVWQLGRLSAEAGVSPETSGDQRLRPRPTADAASTRLWAVPWIPLAVVVLAAATLAWRRWRRRRRAAGQSSARRPGAALPGRVGSTAGRR